MDLHTTLGQCNLFLKRKLSQLKTPKKPTALMKRTLIQETISKIVLLPLTMIQESPILYVRDRDSKYIALILGHCGDIDIVSVLGRDMGYTVK